MALLPSPCVIAKKELQWPLRARGSLEWLRGSSFPPLVLFLGGNGKSSTRGRWSPSQPPLCAMRPEIQFPSAESTAGGERQVYQPFRPPVNPGNSAQDLSIEQQLEILRERRGLWHEYSVFVSSLSRAGYTPSMIGEATGVSGVEQNKIVVASQVLASLRDSGMAPEFLAYYDIGGADVLYELRILSARQREAAAEFAAERRMDPKEASELARAMKDFDRRKRDEGWSAFSFTPGDCLAFACYRQSKEFQSDHKRTNVLNLGLSYVSTEPAREKLLQALRNDPDEQDENDVPPSEALPCIRLSTSELSESTSPIVIPLLEPTLKDIEAAPSVRTLQNKRFRVHQFDSGWTACIVLPRWEPLTSSAAPVAISFPNASILPWKMTSRKDAEEPIMLLVDKNRKEIDAFGFFLVVGEGDKLCLQRGSVVSETNAKHLGRAIIALRPPLADSGLDIEWD